MQYERQEEYLIVSVGMALFDYKVLQNLQTDCPGLTWTVPAWAEQELAAKGDVGVGKGKGKPTWYLGPLTKIIG